MNISKDIFRGYDIRGVYGEDLTEEVARAIGMGYAKKLKEIGGNKVIVGMDNRKSSPSLKKSLVDALIESGIDVIDLGLVTSPMLYYANELFNISAGAMVTASHNPKEYNGFKIAFDKKGEICGDEIIEFRDLVISGAYLKSDKKGTYEEKDIYKLYVNMLNDKFNFSCKIKIVVDCGNGTASVIASKVFYKFIKEKQIDVVYICSDSDPDYPYHHPDPAESENLEMLKQKVLEVGADLGISYDGDADRVGFIDETGKVLDMDYMLAIFSRYILPKSENKNIFFDVSCSKTLSDEIEKYGGIPCVYKTGNSYIKRAMLDKGSIFGGEISGHTFFNDKFFGFDDGIYASLRMIEILSENNIKLSTLIADLNKYYSSPVIKLTVKESNKKKIVEKFKEECINLGYEFNDIDGVRIEFDDGFALVRMSNTTPKLTIRFEGNTSERLQELESKFMPILKKVIQLSNN